MKYRNAKDVLPRDLLDAVREYASGELLYIPKADAKRSEWGTLTGTRSILNKRNTAIRVAYEGGTDITDIAKKYCLSTDSIKKIVYANPSDEKDGEDNSIR